MTLPYASSKAGQSRESEIRAILKKLGATAIGFMVDDERDVVITQFRLQGREITIPITVGAYERAWLRENPHSNRMRSSPAEHKRKARAVAEAAVWAIMVDWVKAQAMMIECGFMDVETAFLPHVHLESGQRAIEHVRENLPALPAPT